MSVNKVILVGNVGKEPEIRHLEGGASVASFSLATSERYRDKSGNSQEITEWHNIVAWRQLADLAGNYIHKGTQIYVEGRLRTRSWDDQNGQKRYQTEINADVIQLLGRKGDGAFAPAPAPTAAPAAAPAAAPSAPAPRPVSEPMVSPADLAQDDGTDDLPF